MSAQALDPMVTPSRAASPPAAARPGAVSGTQRTILRLEGGAVLAVAAAAYAHWGAGWGFFALMFLVPDVSMLGYLRGSRVGAAFYNAGHSYLGPAALGAFGLTAAQPLAMALALIWVAHIGFDRMLGYGLKHVAGFGFTHLGAVGSARNA